jgi:hypothetical protein
MMFEKYQLFRCGTTAVIVRVSPVVSREVAGGRIHGVQVLGTSRGAFCRRGREVQAIDVTADQP